MTLWKLIRPPNRNWTVNARWRVSSVVYRYQGYHPEVTVLPTSVWQWTTLLKRRNRKVYKFIYALFSSRYNLILFVYCPSVMRLGKKKEKERDSDGRSQTVEGVSRLICSVKTSHSAPMRGKIVIILQISFSLFIYTWNYSTTTLVLTDKNLKSNEI